MNNNFSAEQAEFLANAQDKQEKTETVSFLKSDIEKILKLLAKGT